MRARSDSCMRDAWIARVRCLRAKHACVTSVIRDELQSCFDVIKDEDRCSQAHLRYRYTASESVETQEHEITKILVHCLSDALHTSHHACDFAITGMPR
eukprot:5754206-Pleurochrysis_carterae.AAC.1